MKVMLCVPPMKKSVYFTSSLQSPHLGLASIAALIRTNNHEVRILDAKIFKMSVKQFIDHIVDYRPDIIGMNLVTTEVDFVNSFMGNITKQLPHTMVLAGGPHVSALPEESLNRYRYLDAVVIGEGEEAFSSIVNNIDDLTKIPNLAYRVNGSIHINPATRPVDFSQLPMPAWDLYPPLNYYPIQTVRGCPFSCSFCYNFLGRKVRTRPIQNVIEEIQFLLNYSPAFTECWIIDPTFGVPQKYAFELMHQMIKAGLPKKISWSCHTRIDVASNDMFSLMKESGAYAVGLGIESGSDQVLTETLKSITVKKITEVVDQAKESGLETRGFYIMGHPNETRESVKSTIDLAIKLNTTRSNFGIMVPWPGTKVFKWALGNRKGYRLLHRNYGKYQKHFGEALEIQGVSRMYMNLMRVKGYVLVYLKNRRYVDFLRFVRSYFPDALQLGMSLIQGGIASISVRLAKKYR